MKQLFDILISLTLLLLLLPVFLILMILVKIKLGSPVFFCQERPGKNGKAFRMIKFRSMTNAVDTAGKLLPNEQRMTNFGRWLRSTSLDELPELFNVLKGEMSLVGPRPLLMDYLPLYNDFQRRRNEVKPGITGWAQVNGRNAISWEEKFVNDVWYVDHRNLFLDFSILILTVWKVLFERGDVNHQHNLTMPRFTGSKAIVAKPSLVIVGAGSVGGHLAMNLEDYAAKYDLIGFVDDDPAKQNRDFFGYPVLGPVSLLLEMKGVNVLVGLAFPKVKRKIIETLSLNKSLNFPAFISGRAWISNGTAIGKGCIIYPGAAINYGCEVQDFVVINMNCAIGHDCTIGTYSSLAPGVNFAGHTWVGEAVDVGIGSSTRQQVRLDHDAVIGGQAMVITDVMNNTCVFGIPAETSHTYLKVNNVVL